MSASINSPSSVQYPRFTDPVVQGKTFHGVVCVLQTNDQEYSLVYRSMEASTPGDKNPPNDISLSYVHVAPTVDYKIHSVRDTLRSSFRHIIWVAQNAPYTIIAVNLHSDRVIYLWRTSLRYALGKKKADILIASWLIKKTSTGIGSEKTMMGARIIDSADRCRVATKNQYYTLKELIEYSATHVQTKTFAASESSDPDTKISSPASRLHGFIPADNRASFPPVLNEAEVQSRSVSLNAIESNDLKAEIGAGILDLPPELQLSIFSYLDSDTDDVAQQLPSTWVSSWTLWQRNIVMTCRVFFQLLQDRLHERIALRICTQCCSSGGEIKPCERKCAQRWHALSKPRAASCIRQLEVRPDHQGTLSVVTASEICSAIANCTKLQELRWPAKFNFLPKPAQFPDLLTIWGPVAYFRGLPSGSLDRLRHVTLEMGRNWERIPPMAEAEHLRIIINDKTRSVNLVTLDCLDLPKLKSLNVEQVYRFPANVHIFAADRIPLETLRLKHCWCTRRLLASLPRTLRTLQLDECENARRPDDGDHGPIEFPAMRALNIFGEDKERFLSFFHADSILNGEKTLRKRGAHGS